MRDMRFKTFPPRWGYLKVPTRSRADAAAGLSLYSPCRRAAILAHRVSVQIAHTFGPQFLPGPVTEWAPSFGKDAWRDLLGIFRSELGAFDSYAIYEKVERPQLGFLIALIAAGKLIACIKVRSAEDRALRIEFDALKCIATYHPRSFVAPTPLLLSDYKDVRYFAMTAVAFGVHSVPLSPPMALIAREIHEALNDWSRPPDTPRHWRPMHGDLTPWNMRESADGTLWLVDWEETKWGPPGADEVLYFATESVVKHTPPPVSNCQEAIRYWRAMAEHRAMHSRNRDTWLYSKLLPALAAMER